MSEKKDAGAGAAPEDERYMARALELAERGRGRVSPNPLVGAVIVRSGRILGEGAHERYGGPHAEANAVRDARRRGHDDLRGAAIYVNLEPCSHFGKTPPCADLIVSCGMGRVVYGMRDPNPLVAGRGIRRLEEAGIRVEQSALEKACRALNRPFEKHVLTRLPFVTLKTALSLDGKTAAPNGESRWISGERSRENVHRLRLEHGAVLCGIGTVLADDPELTVRLSGIHRDQQPTRIVADTRFRIPETCALVRTAKEAPAWIAVAEDLFSGPGSAEINRKRETLESAGVIVIPIPAHGPAPRGSLTALDLNALAAEIGRRGINGVLLEGGAALAAGALQAGIVDRLRYYLAPTLIGGSGAPGAIGGTGCGPLASAWRLRDINIERLEEDLVIDARLDYSGRPSCSPV